MQSFAGTATRAAMQSGYLGIPTAYEIKDGKIVTWFANAPFEVAVFKLGDKHYGARSNEFGFANYEMITQPVELERLNLKAGAEISPTAPAPKARN